MKRVMRRVGARLWLGLRLVMHPGELWRVSSDPNLAVALPDYRERNLRAAAAAMSVLIVGAIAAGIWWGAYGIAAVVGIVMTIAGVDAVRARRSAGRRRGLPPGSLGFGTRPIVDRDFFFRRSAIDGAVFKTHHAGRPMVAIVGLREARDLFDRSGAALGPVPLDWNRHIPGNFIRWMRGPAHAVYRRRLAAAMAAPVLRSAEPVLLPALGRAVADFAAGPPVHPTIRLESAVVEAFTEIFFGFRPGTDPFETFRRDLEALSLVERRSDVEVHEAIDRLIGVVAAQAQTDGGSTTVLDGWLKQDPAALEDCTAMTNLLFLLESGAGDIGGLLTWIAKHAADHPSHMDAIRRDPDPAHPRSFANRFVAETLRLAQSEHLFRITRRDVTVGEYVIPAGWLVRVCVRESHLDPRFFPDPERHDPDRFLERPPAATYQPFGIDDHTCVGAPLARLTARVFLQELASYELDVVADGPVAMSRRRHWAPSPDFRLRVRQR